MIAILCPTRRRHKLCLRLADSIRATSETKLYLGTDSIDLMDCKLAGVLPHDYIYTNEWPTSHKWNVLAQEAMKDQSNKLFMLGADDMYFATEGWDKALIDHYNSLENKIHVYALQDSRDENGTPHVIVTREYIEAMGYFVPPIFLHWYIDTWTVEIAKANNCFTHLREYSLVHDKPSDQGNWGDFIIR